jgi:hypothetical protein
MQKQLSVSECLLTEIVRSNCLKDMSFLQKKLEDEGRKVEATHTLYKAKLDYGNTYYYYSY